MKALLRRALEHSMKAHAWPDSIAVRTWRNEVNTFLTNVRRDLEPGMAQHLDAAELYAESLKAVRKLDMLTAPRPLPERIALTVADFYDEAFGADEPMARIANAPA